MPKFFILIIASYILGNIYIFVRGLQALGHLSTAIRVTFIVFYWLFALLLIVVMAARNSQMPFLLGHTIFQIGSGWLVFILYMVIFLFCMDIIKIFNKSFSYGFVTALVLTVSLLVYGFINYKHPKKQVINIAVNKPLNDGNKLRIVAVSDWHLGYGTTEASLRKNVDLINEQKPDIILIGGDLIDNSIIPVVSQGMDKELNRLEAPMGIYMAPGNHEYISGLEQCEEFISKTKIQLLIDKAITLPCGLQIIGRNDYSNKNRMTSHDWEKITDSSLPTIIIDHQPQNLNEARQIGADIQFSGHTHNGQVFPLNLITSRLFELSYGYEKREDTHYYVSSGFTLWGPPFRIGSVSEFVVFDCTFTK